MAKKNLLLALILSFIWSGLGIIYVGEVRKGIFLAILAVIFQYITNYHYPFAFIGFLIICIYSLYETYKEVKAFNGDWTMHISCNMFFAVTILV